MLGWQQPALADGFLLLVIFVFELCLLSANDHNYGPIRQDAEQRHEEAVAVVVVRVGGSFDQKNFDCIGVKIGDFDFVVHENLRR